MARTMSPTCDDRRQDHAVLLLRIGGDSTDHARFDVNVSPPVTQARSVLGIGDDRRHQRHSGRVSSVWSAATGLFLPLFRLTGTVTSHIPPGRVVLCYAAIAGAGMGVARRDDRLAGVLARSVPHPWLPAHSRVPGAATRVIGLLVGVELIFSGVRAVAAARFSGPGVGGCVPWESVSTSDIGEGACRRRLPLDAAPSRPTKPGTPDDGRHHGSFPEARSSL
jgi:hypothetical protein